MLKDIKDLQIAVYYVYEIMIWNNNTNKNSTTSFTHFPVFMDESKAKQ